MPLLGNRQLGPARHTAVLTRRTASWRYWFSMSVYVASFTDANSWEVLHDEAGHGGTIDPATVKHVVGPDGVENHNYLMIVCPMCDSVSTHPVGGGAQPLSVQQMFVNHVNAN